MKTTTTTAFAATLTELLPHTRIAERAYAIWLARGQPAGCDYDHWVEAEHQLLVQRLEEESESGLSPLNYWNDPFTTDIDEALDAMAPTYRQRSATSL